MDAYSPGGAAGAAGKLRGVASGKGKHTVRALNPQSGDHKRPDLAQSAKLIAFKNASRFCPFLLGASRAQHSCHLLLSVSRDGRG